MTSTVIRALIVGAACAVLVVAAWSCADSVIDDAYIVFRYADHLVAGLGPVFNPGERVEGFTSPSWLLVIAAARFFGLGPEGAVTGLGIVLGVGAVVATWALARRVASGYIALIAPLLLALHPAHAMWAVHGLETPLFVLLVAMAFATLGAPSSRAAWGAGILFGCAFWTRPEAAMFVILLALLAVARGDMKRAPRLIVGFAALAIPLLAARFAYYGALVPNTFHAKTGGGLGRVAWGIGYAHTFVRAHLPIVLACAAAAAILLVRIARARRAAVARGAPAIAVDMAVCGAVWSAWVVWIGGDGFPGFRFWVPVLPLAGALAGWTAEIALDERRGKRRTAAVLATTSLGLASIVVLARADVRREYETGKEFTARMVAVGDWLGRNAPSGTTIALNYIGAVPYRSGLRAIDMLGLTDAEVARTPIEGRFRFPGHAKGNGASVLDRRPSLILMGGVYLAPDPMERLGPELDSEEQIAADPRFRAEYERVQVRIPAPGGTRWFAFYKRRDLAWSPGGARIGEAEKP